MAAVLENWHAAVEAVWEGTSPPAPDDGSGATYTFVDTLDGERGNGRHRELIWRLPPRLQPLLEEALQTRWTSIAELFIARHPGNAPRTYAAFRQAVTAETMALVAAYQDLQNLGTRVAAGVLVDARIIEETPERDRSGMGAGLPQDVVARVRFTFSVETQEG